MLYTYNYIYSIGNSSGIIYYYRDIASYYAYLSTYEYGGSNLWYNDQMVIDTKTTRDSNIMRGQRSIMTLLKE